jgi:hypothetical protein
MSTDVSALRDLLRRKYGSSNTTLSQLVRILEREKGSRWLLEYNDVVEWCDDYGEDLNWRTVLGHTAHLGLPFVMQGFLDAGMDVGLGDSLGRTELHRVFLRQKLREGHKEVVKILLSRGAEVYSLDKYGRTPISLARKNGHIAILERCMDSRIPAGRSRVQISVNGTDQKTQIQAAQEKRPESGIEDKLERRAGTNEKDTGSPKSPQPSENAVM